MNRQHVVIISGGTVEENLALDILKKQSSAFLIAVDRGLEFFYKHKIKPDYIVGDFDSIAPEIIAWYKEWTEIPIREFNPVKDASDTEIAVRYAVESGYGNITILGGTGTRLDHVMANIQVLSIPARAGIPAEIIDPGRGTRSTVEKIRDLWGIFLFISTRRRSPTSLYSWSKIPIDRSHSCSLRQPLCE